MNASGTPLDGESPIVQRAMFPNNRSPRLLEGYSDDWVFIGRYLIGEHGQVIRESDEIGILKGQQDGAVTIGKMDAGKVLPTHGEVGSVEPGRCDLDSGHDVSSPEKGEG